MSEARAIVVAHGDMATGLIDAVRRISGAPAEALIGVSNEGRSPETLREAILEVLGDDPTVVFTDLGAGSCTLAARLSCAERGRVVVVTGVNLPMLLDFVFHRGLPLDELSERLVEKGRSGVRLLTKPKRDGDPPLPG
jgi:mannose/fructose-specific phosphotransferase system component IIA